MGKHFFKKLNNKGASLIAVLVAISVVSIMGIIITQLTVTNIQMKDVERQAKTNFYDAEHIMDELTAGLNVIASDAMKEAYNEMLSQYRAYSGSSTSPNEAFARLYLDKMVEKFNTTDATKQTTQDKPGASGVDLKRGYYSIATIKGALKKTTVFVPTGETYADYSDDERDSFIKIRSSNDVTHDGAEDSAVNLYGERSFQADYVNHVFILEGVNVSAKDQFGNMVTITTDIVFHTPTINFRGSNLVKEFMRYSLIADKKIENTRTGIKVDGNVYAGKDGIQAKGGSDANFIGKKIVSRGDVTAFSNGTITVGNLSNLTRTQLWVNNVRTERAIGAMASTQPAKINLYGYSYVADDLEVNGKQDEIKLVGEYYGYNFQKNYDALTSTLKDAEYSSAIVINGKKANIDLTGLSRLMVAGRTFISRNAGASNPSDIAMGEALGVRTNQIAYYVPVSCINFTTHTIDDVMYESYSGVANVNSYLKSTEPYTEFNYKIGAAIEKVYYLNFASEQKANDFYAAYYLANGDVLKYYADNYVEANALKLNDSVILQLQGNLLYRSGSTDELVELHTPINYARWGYGQQYYKFSMNHALMYKQLQTNLEEDISELSPDDARIDPAATGMFDTLIDRAKLIEIVEGSNKPAGSGEHEYRKVFTDPILGSKIILLVDGNCEVDATAYSGGLVVATGNVNVKAGSGDQKFCGTIISGNTITFANNGAEVEADEILVSQILSDDIRSAIPGFAMIFNGYGNSAQNAMNTQTINKYLTYDNWTKTYEE